MKLCQELLCLIKEKNFNEIYNILTKNDVEKLYCNSLILSIALIVYQKLGQFHCIANLLNSDLLNLLDNVKIHSKVLQLKIEAEFILAENLLEFENVENDLINYFKQYSSANDSKFIELELLNRLKVIYLQCQIQTKRINNKPELDAGFNKLFKSDEINNELKTFLIHFLNSYLYFYSAEVKDLEISRDEIREAMQFECFLDDFSNFCNITELNAQILIERNQRQLAISQLVNAAQKNQYSSKIFFYLSESLYVTSSLEKAKLCAERARLLNPRSEKIAKLLYEIYNKLVLCF